MAEVSVAAAPRPFSRYFRGATTLSWQIAIGAVALAIWEWGYEFRAQLPWLVPEILDPYFVSKPSEIFARFLRMGCFVSGSRAWNGIANGDFGRCLAATDNNLWAGTLATLRNTIQGFAVGVGSGVVFGLVLGRSVRLARIFEPFIVAFNSIPRIALVPLIVLAFGLGDVSKVVTAWMVVFFLVFFNTFEGTRNVDRDLIHVSRLIGATKWQTMRTVIIPSALVWVFASLSPSISYSLIGVIVGEFIGAQRGIGRIIIEAEAKGDSAAMMAAIFVLMIVGVALSIVIRRVQTYLLRWHPQYQNAS